MAQNSLPIWGLHQQLLAHWGSGNRLVLIAPTGSGKTTQIPQMFLDSDLAGDRKIVVLQPRRVAARTVAARVAWERGGKLGAEVGYQIRFEDETSLGTRICFVTEGILLRWLQDGNDLPAIGMIIFDEFHERNLLSDVALALTKRLQEDRRTDLKIMVMSATLDAEPVAAYLGGCPVLLSEGRSFPVEVEYLKHRNSQPLAEQAAEGVERLVRLGMEGDVLIFMPGMQEIHATIRHGRALRMDAPIDWVPLHGELPPEEQDRAFARSDRRKVVVATNVAETSVTIDGIRTVIDSGQARIARYDAERGIGTLAIEEISQASAEQRRGRAGRTAPGRCLRLWTESNHLNREAVNTPEIQRSDLAEVVLLLHSLGVKAAATFDWLTPPDPVAVQQAERLLYVLGALSGNAAAEVQITAVGRQMLRLPMHPRYARMLLEAREHRCVGIAALCAALVSGRDFLIHLSRDSKYMAEAREQFENLTGSDFFTLIQAFQFARENRFDLEICRRHGLHTQVGQQVAQTHAQLLEIAQKQKLLAENEGQITQEHLMRAIMAGFVDQLCLRKDQGTLDCFVAGGRTGVLARESVVHQSPLFVAANIKEIPAKGGFITLLSLGTAVKLEWLREVYPQHLSTTIEYIYDSTHRRVSGLSIERFLDLAIARTHLKELDPVAAGHCLAKAFQEGHFTLPLFNHEIKQLLGRCNLIARILPELEFPNFDQVTVQECLADAFRGMTLAKEAQGASLKETFQRRIGNERLSWLDELAPGSVSWPDGRRLKLLYADNLAEPEAEIQIKLHECFGLLEHPCICEGKAPIKLWLCAPDGKRLEATKNWGLFKSGQYPKLKPALAKKYPGVIWV